ncbi:hypothetical protein ACFYO0_07180 [Streptomyces sp. NPDC006365]|uniref:hypothetical protein n=1 Tax=Streptomyces sp. NPDC006365 TaxID=3364744 RepID=UPI003675D490
MEEQWDVYLTDEVDQWLHDLEKADPLSYVLVNQAIWILACHGPAEGAPSGRSDQGIDAAQPQGASSRIGGAE